MRLPPPPKLKRQEVTDESESAQIQDEVTEEEKPVVSDRVTRMQQRIKKLLKMSSYAQLQPYWLDSGYPELNAVFGSAKKGIPYGRIYETSGVKHGGKTAIGTILAGMAQKDGAAVIYADLEQSRDPEWADKLGLDFSDVLPIWPKLLKGRKTKKEKKDKAVVDSEDLLPRLQSTESLFKEVETALALNFQDGYEKQFVLFDSIANITTEMAVEAGATDRNMRVNLDRAQFLSANLPRWAGLAANYNAMIFFINQLRVNPGQMFGDKHYTPGGSGVPFSASIQVRVRRIGKGQIEKNGSVVGIRGALKNMKNKAGAGSNESEEVAFEIRWDRPMAKVKFFSVEDTEL